MRVSKLRHERPCDASSCISPIKRWLQLPGSRPRGTAKLPVHASLKDAGSARVTKDQKGAGSGREPEPSRVNHDLPGVCELVADTDELLHVTYSKVKMSRCDVRVWYISRVPSLATRSTTVGSTSRSGSARTPPSFHERPPPATHVPSFLPTAHALLPQELWHRLSSSTFDRLRRRPLIRPRRAPAPAADDAPAIHLGLIERSRWPREAPGCN
jgi:hypothetical protein